MISVLILIVCPDEKYVSLLEKNELCYINYTCIRDVINTTICYEIYHQQALNNNNKT